MQERIICVHGNIGAGKTTLIESEKYNDFIRMKEPVDDWADYLPKYYKALQNKQPKLSLSLSEQSDIVEFQILTTLSRLMAYQQIEPDKKYIFERSIQESHKCFCQVLKKYLDKDIFAIVNDFMAEAIKFEPNFDKNIYLHEPRQTLMERIAKRNRNGEDIQAGFLDELQKHYTNFSQESVFQKDWAVKNNVYVIGPVSSGKTTFIEKLKLTGAQVQTEPIEYWQPFLQLHLYNIEHKDNANRIEEFEQLRNNTFFFQLKCLVSRLRFRKNGQIHERILLEEPYIFMEQYKPLFTKTQYNLMMKLYDFFGKYVFQIGQQVIYYIRTPIERQLLNVSMRNRMNETHIYNKEYVEKMNALYKKMEDDPEIKEVKEKGNFYNINYDGATFVRQNINKATK